MIGKIRTYEVKSLNMRICFQTFIYPSEVGETEVCISKIFFQMFVSIAPCQGVSLSI